MSTPSARTGGSLDAWFKISARGSTVRQEIVAGLTTFLAMVYSVIVVPGMLGKAGFPPAAVFVSTCLVAGVGSLAMGIMGESADGDRLRYLVDRLHRLQPGAGAADQYSGSPRRSIPDGGPVYGDLGNRHSQLDLA